LRKWYRFSPYRSSRMDFTARYLVNFISLPRELVLTNIPKLFVLTFLLNLQEYWLDVVSRRSAHELISVRSTWPAFPWPCCLHLSSILTEWYVIKVLQTFPVRGFWHPRW
jgi:hypothetical protein